MFSRDYWASADALGRNARADAAPSRIVHDRTRARWVLRHYRRGGWLREALRRSVFVARRESRPVPSPNGACSPSCVDRGLPVPAPLPPDMSRGRTDVSGRSDDRAIADMRGLSRAAAITGLRLIADRGRRSAARSRVFIAQGVHHADLNANNILLAARRRSVYLLDFDRGRIRARGAWEERVLARLRRSLEKIKVSRRGCRVSRNRTGSVAGRLSDRRISARATPRHPLRASHSSRDSPASAP